jgi:hypothetical protein
MCAQIPEQLIFEGEKHQMFTEPLEDYREQGGKFPKLVLSPTNLSRGYFGTWKIVDSCLHLIAIDAVLASGKPADLVAIFPACGSTVFAGWYTGTIQLPQGKVLKRVSMGYCDVYERDLLLAFKKGILKTRNTRTNSMPIEVEWPSALSKIEMDELMQELKLNLKKS